MATDQNTSFPDMSSAAGQALERCNRCCGAYLQNWYRFSGVQWTPGMIADAALRGRMDSFMPWEALRSALAALGRTYLPEPQWLPQLLAPRMLENICDFWAELPQFSGRLTFRRDSPAGRPDFAIFLGTTLI